MVVVGSLVYVFLFCVFFFRYGVVYVCYVLFCVGGLCFWVFCGFLVWWWWLVGFRFCCCVGVGSFCCG